MISSLVLNIYYYMQIKELRSITYNMFTKSLDLTSSFLKPDKVPSKLCLIGISYIDFLMSNDNTYSFIKELRPGSNWRLVAESIYEFNLNQKKMTNVDVEYLKKQSEIFDELHKLFIRNNYKTINRTETKELFGKLVENAREYFDNKMKNY
ncbi:hypothetical protein [Caloranaerobacter ferrireducens]|uniref:hypothetical protein n=1 Tax=Caloranaerobacter ferrireducens TaxID=1323370 RepID=UPI00159F319E|nr:hypothetical protein [Caloranaerobacter ferrireducens]